MVRLRESIKQKEEFLKSPIPSNQQRFFNNASPHKNPQHNKQQQLSILMSNAGATRGHNKALVKQPQSMTRDLLPANFDLHNFYVKNIPQNFTINSMMDRGGHGEFVKTIVSRSNRNAATNSACSSGSSTSSNSNSSNSMKEKFHKELEYLESLPETGVTNQV